MIMTRCVATNLSDMAAVNATPQEFWIGRGYVGQANAGTNDQQTAMLAVEIAHVVKYAGLRYAMCTGTCLQHHKDHRCST